MTRNEQKEEENKNIMTNRKLTCTVVERKEKKKISHHMIKCCN
jgi:hypothetical protein